MEGGVILARILYIDDDPGIARLVQRHLQRVGYEVTIARSGAEGLALAGAGGFDAIGLDHYMPGQDGLEVLEALRGLAGAPPVIFCTGAEEPRIAVAALKSGAADYVVKDVHGTFIDLLAASIAQEITHARLQRERDDAERAVREARDRFEALSARQAVLLREMNHRIANSLQLISALIDMQARRVPDGAARAMLRQAAERVEAVTLVHRRLYTTDDVEYVEMDAYLSGLVEELRRATQGGDTVPHIVVPDIVVHVEPLRVATDKAVSIGLIVNELVTNAVKYAYVDWPAGRILVSLTRNTAGAPLLVVEDDGIGYPSSDMKPKGSGLGSMIVKSMARALHATVTLDAAHRGTRFIIAMEA